MLLSRNGGSQIGCSLFTSTRGDNSYLAAHVRIPPLLLDNNRAIGGIVLSCCCGLAASDDNYLHLTRIQKETKPPPASVFFTGTTINVAVMVSGGGDAPVERFLR